MTKLTKLPRVTAVEVLPPHALRVSFDDGVVKDVDLADELWGPLFEPLRDAGRFAEVRVEKGVVCWPNGADLDPLVLHGDFPPAAAPAEHRAR